MRGELPVLVFAGAPFTVATYCIGTGKDMAATRRFAAEQPAVWDALARTALGGDGPLPEHADRATGPTCTSSSTRGPGCSTPRSTTPWAQPHHAGDLRGRDRACRASCSSRKGPYLDADGAQRGGRDQPRQRGTTWRRRGATTRTSSSRATSTRRCCGRARRSRWRKATRALRRGRRRPAAHRQPEPRRR